MYARRPFGIDETHGMLAQPSARIKANSDGRDWTSMFASVQRETPFQGVFQSSRDHLLVLHRDGPVQVESLCDRRIGKRVVPAGGIHIISPGVDFGINLTGSIETVHVYVRRAIIEEVALEMVDGDPAKLEIPSSIVETDKALHALIDASAYAVEDESIGSSMFTDYLSRTIAAQLIRGYSKAKLKGGGRVSGAASLSPTLSDAVDYMTANIDEAINLADIAQATNRSPSHIARIFRTELGMPPHRYLINLRVDKARRLLEKTSMSIAEIAYECGFAHQEHLTRLFRRHCGTTPAAYRRSKRN
ncbi:HTH-type transcriptional activator Btr [Devosia equisanguinis]|uniref:HTH-type transcriptional activator Btr n=1 Tax=Devosia equisanguinis TaxID=2490941 RepID=A0A3S5D392_9HYPH|nr:AraC family transcriptional regulator [Devosia equisanguinis]VDS03816.1 HTH-type transcriptional activator Btr [Devosia equisanguinis]